jgi:hypothetical protein
MRTALFTLLIGALSVSASLTSEAWKNKKTSELTDQQRERLAKKKEYIRAAVGVGKPVEDKVEEEKPVDEKVEIKDA